VKREASTRAPLARHKDGETAIPSGGPKKETAKTVSQLQSLKTTEMTLSTTSCRSGGQTDGQTKVSTATGRRAAPPNHPPEL